MSSAYPPPPQPGNYDPPPQYGQPQPQYGGQVVHMQPVPQPMTVIAAPPKPDDHMALACFVFWCCNWICGLCGIYYASQTNSSYSSGQYDVAESNSKKAKLWSKIGLIVGVIEIVVAVIFIIVWYTVLAGMFVRSSY